MLLQKFETPGLAHYAYLLGCGEGKAVLVDPRRDVAAYVDAAREHGVAIAYILATHRQEDFELGTANLAATTGARIVTGTHELFGRSDLKLADGAVLEVGTTRIVVLATPGHTPESVSYAVYLGNAADVCWAVFTGDALFPGATGRTDLADPAKTAQNAGVLYDSVHQRLAPLGDQALVLAAHGAGSACGSNISDRDPSTLGIERKSNPVFTRDRAGFIASKVDEKLPRPPYFRHMEEVNLAGGRPLPDQRRIAPLSPSAFEAGCDGRLVIDTRAPDAFASSHIAAALNIWLGGLPSYAGWFAAPDTRILLVVASPSEVRTAAHALARVGLDHVDGFLAGGMAAWREAGLPIAQTGVVSAARAAAWQDAGQARILDVRDATEWSEGHIPEALHTYVGDLPDALPAQARDAPLVVHCSVGNRAGIATSLLARAGFSAVHNMLGGLKAWKALGLPLVKE